MLGRLAPWLLLVSLLAGCAWEEDLPRRLPLRVQAAEPGELLAGAAAVAIPPAPDCELAGYSIFRDATGQLDPPNVRCLYLARGDLRLALLCFDFIGLQRGAILTLTEALAAQSGLPADAIVIHCTHTHAGPDTLGLWGFPPFWSGIDEDYTALYTEAAGQVLSTAMAEARAVTVRAATRRIDPTGLAHNIRRPGLEDDTLGVLGLTATDGSGAVATVVSFGCHPEVLGRDNTLISADFPAPLTAWLEQHTGGVGLFWTGAVGALVSPENGPDERAEMVRIGEALATLGAELLEGASATTRVRLAMASTAVAIPLDNAFYSLLWRLGWFDREKADGCLITEVRLIDIAGLWIATVPGELAPDLAWRIRRELDHEPLIILGLAQDELGYLLSSQDYELALYDYERTLCPAPTAGERIVESLGWLAVALRGPRGAGPSAPSPSD